MRSAKIAATIGRSCLSPILCLCPFSRALYMRLVNASGDAKIPASSNTGWWYLQPLPCLHLRKRSHSAHTFACGRCGYKCLGLLFSLVTDGVPDWWRAASPGGDPGRDSPADADATGAEPDGPRSRPSADAVDAEAESPRTPLEFCRGPWS